MKLIHHLINQPNNTFGKTLYFIALCLVLGGASVAANYAMIYRHTAMAVSYLSLAGVAYWFYTFQKDKKPRTLLWILMLSVFTLHKWWIVAVIILEIISRKMKTNVVSTPTTEQQQGFWQILMIVPAYLVMDVAREYSVWHTFTINYFPDTAMLFILLMAIYLFRRQR